MIYERKNWKLDFIKSLWFVKCTVKKMKQQVTDWEKIFIEQISDKGLVTKMYFKKTLKLNERLCGHLA